MKKIYLLLILNLTLVLYSQPTYTEEEIGVLNSITPLIADKKYNEILEILQVELPNKPDSLIFNYYLGWVLMEQNNYLEAEYYLEKSAQVAEEDQLSERFNIFNDLGWTQFRNGKPEAALKTLDKVIESNDSVITDGLVELALNNKGTIHLFNNSLVEAEEAFNKSKETFQSYYAIKNLEYIESMKNKSE